jgi:hypothetical protein
MGRRPLQPIDDDLALAEDEWDVLPTEESTPFPSVDDSLPGDLDDEFEE